MSVQVMGWVLEHSEEALGRRLVLLSIANHAGAAGIGARPSYETLAREARLSRRQAMRCVRDLEAAGAIEVSRGTGRGGTNEYRVIMAPGDNLSPAAVADVTTASDAGVTRTVPEPSSAVPTSTPPTGLSSSARPAKPRPRNEHFDAFAAWLGYPPPATVPKPIAGMIGRALAVIRQAEPDVSPAEITRACARLPKDWRAPTPLAVANHWHHFRDGGTEDRRVRALDETYAGDVVAVAYPDVTSPSEREMLGLPPLPEAAGG